LCYIIYITYYILLLVSHGLGQSQARPSQGQGPWPWLGIFRPQAKPSQHITSSASASASGGHWEMIETPPLRRNTRGRCGVPPSRVSMRGGRWGVVKTPPSCRNARGRCRVGRNAPVSRFDARGVLGSGRKGDGDCHQQHCLLLMALTFRL